MVFQYVFEIKSWISNFNSSSASTPVVSFSYCLPRSHFQASPPVNNSQWKQMLSRVFPVTTGSSRRSDSFSPVHCSHHCSGRKSQTRSCVHNTPHGTFRDLASFMTQRPQSRFDLMKYSDIHKDVMFSPVCRFVSRVTSKLKDGFNKPEWEGEELVDDVP